MEVGRKEFLMEYEWENADFKEHSQQVPLLVASVVSDVLHSAFQSSISMIINDSYNCSKITFYTGEDMVLIGEFMLLKSVTAQ